MTNPQSHAHSTDRADEPPRPRDARRAVALSGHGLLPDRSTFQMTVLDLSYDGCRITSEVALLPGVKFLLSFGTLGALDAEVRWYRDGEAGLFFGDYVATTNPHKPRATDRVKKVADVVLRREGRNPYSSRVFDLSPSGCKVEYVEVPRVGERIWSKFDGLESIEGEVMWVNQHHGGIRFIRPIHPAVFDLLSQRLG